MNTASEIKPNDRPAPLNWEPAKSFLDDTSKLRLEVKRAQLPNGRSIYSIQLGIMKEKLSPYIPIMFNRESTSWSSEGPRTEFDYVEICSRLMKAANEYILDEKKLEMLVERDNYKANKDKPTTKQTGKTQREREKRANKK